MNPILKKMRDVVREEHGSGGKIRAIVLGIDLFKMYADVVHKNFESCRGLCVEGALQFEGFPVWLGIMDDPMGFIVRY